MNTDKTKLLDLENTDTSFAKLGTNGEILIACFASNAHSGFEWKTTLLEIRKKHPYTDLLFMRNRHGWYLGGLNGIGKNINHTIAFLKKEFAKYDRIICIGSSQGGYASILFGSLLGANDILAAIPQTDLEYAVSNCRPAKQKFSSRRLKCAANNLFDVIAGNSKIISFKSFEKYKNLNTLINKFSKYFIICQENAEGLHGFHHCENIPNYDNVEKHLHPQGWKSQGVVVAKLTKIFNIL